MKHPRDAFRSQAYLEQTWKALAFLSCPDFDEACRQYDAFARLLESLGVTLRYLPRNEQTDPDSLYTHDPATSIGSFLVGCSMGKENRRPEVAAVRSAVGSDYTWREITSPGLLEGGDLIWLDERTVAVGVGFRSNHDGINQLGDLTGVEVLPVPLPWWNGPSDCLHLMSLISPLADDLALVYRPLLPVPFVQELEARGIQLVDVPKEEYDSLGCNVLAVSPRVCVAVEGNPVTAERMRAAGCEVHTFSGSEICLKGLGGPSCLTRPLFRG
ncbi:MAG: amidinotransferase [Rhodothermales bacterium]|nr:amidinotransferase [Rhodothermales bacterium]